MGIIGIEQPNIIQIDETLRLKMYNGIFDFAYSWYQDAETLKLVDGINSCAYDMNKLHRMYEYLNNHGELYFIEIYDNGNYIPIGDVTFWQEDMPIVIGDLRYRNCGIGARVIKALIQRAKTIGYDAIYVNEIYSYNLASQAMFTKVGFIQYKSTDNGFSYKLDLK